MHVRKPAEAVWKKRGSKVWVVFVGVLWHYETTNLATQLRKPGGSSAEATLALEAICEHRVACPGSEALANNMQPPTLV